MVHPGIRVGEIPLLVERGEVVLPEFQRGFVWRPAQVLKFLDSLYREFPTGQILLWLPPQDVWERIRGHAGRALEKESGKPSESVDLSGLSSPPQFVLDGQQRLTSLYHVLKDEPGFHARFHVETEEFQMDSPGLRKDPRWVNVATVLGSDHGLSQALVQLQKSLGIGIDDPSYAQFHASLERLAMVRQRVLGVELVRLADVESVTELFIRTNSGTPLKRAELALARLAWRWPGALVRRFEDAVEELRDSGFDLSAPFLMRCFVAVSTGQSGFQHLDALWSLNDVQLSRNWERTHQGLRAAVAFVREVAHIYRSEDLPSHNALLPLVALFAGDVRLNEADTYRLLYWFLVASTYGRYGASIETRLNEDLRAVTGTGGVAALIEALEAGGREPPRVSPEDLEGRGHGSSIYFLWQSLSQLQAPRDWFPAQRGAARRPLSATRKPYPIFSRARLAKEGMEEGLSEEVANLVLLPRLPEETPEGLAPDQVLSPLSPEFLAEAWIPRDRTLWFAGKAPEFLAVRRALMAGAFTSALRDLRAGAHPTFGP